MANHLIPNALLRPHGTNNPYNTLLGESAVYNNPLGMYNTQGVQASSLSCGLWSGPVLSALVTEKLRGGRVFVAARQQSAIHRF